MKIAILVDDPHSWFIPYSNNLCTQLAAKGYCVKEYTSSKDVGEEEICFILSCTRILKQDFLKKHAHNIVVHASDLPKGKGFTPMKWQVLEGKNEIVLTLFEAVEECDAGPYYFKDKIAFAGYELLDDMQNMMGEKILEMCCRFVEHIDEMVPIQQHGDSTYYRRFNSDDDTLDVDMSIRELFPRMRIADNSRFPLMFTINGHKYSIVVKRLD